MLSCAINSQSTYPEKLYCTSALPMAMYNIEMPSGLIPEIYLEFAPVLAKYRCIWDPKNHEYGKERHHKKAYEMIEMELNWKC